MTCLSPSGQNLNSRLKLLKIGIPPDSMGGMEAVNFEGFVATENSEVVI